MLTLQHASQLFHHLRLRNSRSSRQSLLERDLGHEDHVLDHMLDEQLPEEQTTSCICGTRKTRTCTIGTWCSKSLEACRGTPASGSRSPPTSSQSNTSKDAGWEETWRHTSLRSLPLRCWPSSVPVGRCGAEAQPRPSRRRHCLREGRVFRTLTTYFTCSPPPRSWPSSVHVGRRGSCSSKALGNGHRDLSISILLKHLCGKKLLFDR